MNINIIAALALCFAAIGAQGQTAEKIERAQRIHRESIVLDSHADTPLDFTRGAHLGVHSDSIRVSMPRLARGGVSAQYLACWVRQKGLTDAGRMEARQRIEELLDSCESQVARNADKCALAVSAADVRRIKTDGKVAFLLGVENGYGVGVDIDMIDHYASRGVSYITLCHTKNNDICDSSSDAAELWGGLSPFGRDVVRRMNEVGMLVDLSHASEKTFWDVLAITTAPVVCSHSSAAALFSHDRNLTDEQLRALAANGGVAQICAVDEFLTSDPKKATFDDFMAHLLHAIDVAGVDHVGVGSDFDGGGGVHGFNGSDDFLNITLRLIDEGFSDGEIAKILGGNFLRVLEEAQNLND